MKQKVLATAIDSALTPERPVCYIFSGVPGSGKSTYAKKLVGSLADKDFVVISSDDYLDQKAEELGMTYSQVYEKYIGQAVAAMDKALTAAIAARRNIIIDKTSVSKKNRRGLLDQLPVEYLKYAVVFDVPDQVLKQRLADRAAKTGKIIPEQVLKDMFSRWETPTRKEGFDAIIKA